MAFETGVPLIVKGELSAVGTETDSIVFRHKTVEINEKGLVTVDDKGDKVLLHADTIILSVGFRPQSEMSRDFREKVDALNPEIEVYEIGDCVKCDRIYHAINSGAHVAWQLGSE